MGKKNRFILNNNSSKNIQIATNSGYYKLTPIFSFADYIETSEYFSEEHANETRNSLYKFLHNIRELSKLSWGEIQSKPKTFHFHEIKKDIPILSKKEYNSVDIFQVKIPGQKQGRFIGFFDKNNVFHILIYDSQHNVYERK